MSILKITHNGIVPPTPILDKLVDSKDPILHETMPYFDFSFRKSEAIPIANRIITVFQSCKCLGLAAPQIGIRANVLVAGNGNDIVAYFNPEILIQSTDTIKLEEGCMSFNQLFLKIVRPKYIMCRYQDYNGVEHTKEFDGLTARIFLHEYDHLQGKVFTDLVGETAIMMAKNKQKKLLGKK